MAHRGCKKNVTFSFRAAFCIPSFQQVANTRVGQGNTLYLYNIVAAYGMKLLSDILFLKMYKFLHCDKAVVLLINGEGACKKKIKIRCPVHVLWFFSQDPCSNCRQQTVKCCWNFWKMWNGENKNVRATCLVVRCGVKRPVFVCLC